MNHPATLTGDPMTAATIRDWAGVAAAVPGGTTTLDTLDNLGMIRWPVDVECRKWTAPDDSGTSYGCQRHTGHPGPCVNAEQGDTP